MKKLLILLLLFSCFGAYSQVQLADGYGFTIGTTAELTAIPNKADGDIYYNSDTKNHVKWEDGVFVNLGGGLSGTDQAKLNNISITQSVDLDVLESDTNTNNTKVSYPGDASVTITESQISDLSHTVDTDDQTISISGNIITLERGTNTIDLNPYLDNVNNYVDGITVTGTTTKTITLTRSGLPDLTANFNDISGAGGDGNDFLTAVTESGGTLTFNVSGQTNPTFDLDAFLATKNYLSSSSNVVYADTDQAIDDVKTFTGNVVLDFSLGAVNSGTFLGFRKTVNNTNRNAPSGFGEIFFNNDGDVRFSNDGGTSNFSIDFDALTQTRELTVTDTDILWDGNSLLSGGGGSIGGSISDNQLAIGNGTDAIDGSANLTWDGTQIGILGPSADRYIRFSETAGQFNGGYIQYEGSTNKFHFGVHDAADANPSNDSKRLTIQRSDGFIGINNEAPAYELDVSGTLNATGARIAPTFADFAGRFSTGGTPSFGGSRLGDSDLQTASLDIGSSINFIDGTTPQQVNLSIFENNDVVTMRSSGGNKIGVLDFNGGNQAIWNTDDTEATFAATINFTDGKSYVNDFGVQRYIPGASVVAQTFFHVLQNLGGADEMDYWFGRYDGTNYDEIFSVNASEVVDFTQTPTVNGTPIGGGVTDGDKGDITVSGFGTVFTIDDNTIDSGNISNGSINGSDDIQDLSITSGKIAALAITSDKVSADAIDSSKIQDGSITGTDIQDFSINGTNDIQDASITSGKISANGSEGQVLKQVGGVIVLANDETGTGSLTTEQSNRIANTRKFEPNVKSGGATHNLSAEDFVLSTSGNEGTRSGIAVTDGSTQNVDWTDAVITPNANYPLPIPAYNGTIINTLESSSSYTFSTYGGGTTGDVWTVANSTGTSYVQGNTIFVSGGTVSTSAPPATYTEGNALNGIINENDLDGITWNPAEFDVTAIVDPEDAGKFALRVERIAATGTAYDFDIPLTGLVSATTYTVSFRANRTAAANYFQLRLRTVNGWTSDETETPSDTFSDLTFTAQAATSTPPNLNVRAIGGGSPGDVLIIKGLEAN